MTRSFESMDLVPAKLAPSTKAEVFPTLADLGRRHAQQPFRVVDPGVPLANWNAVHGADVWADQPAVRKVTGFIAHQLASTGLQVFRRRGDNDRERLSSHPIASFLADPAKSPGVTPMRFWESLLLDQLLTDRYAAVIEVDERTLLPRRARRLPASRTTFHGRDGVIEWVETYDDDGERIEYDPAKTWMMLGTGFPGTGVMGRSPVDTLRAILEGSTEAVEYRRELMKNRAMLSGVIERDKPWSSEAAQERFSRSFAEFRRQGARAGGVPVLEDSMTWKNVDAFKPVDVQDIEARTLTEVEVATMYWIYPELIGTRPGTYANMRAFRAMLYSVCLGPYYESWRQDLNTQLVPLFTPQSIYVEPNITAKLSGSFEEQADYLSTMVGGPVMTRNEARARLNLSPVEGGDELIVPLNVTEGGQASPQSGKAVTDGDEGIHSGGAREGDALRIVG